MRTTMNPERTAVYLPKGTKARIQAATEDHSITESTFVRIAVLERLKQLEREQQSEHVAMR